MKRRRGSETLIVFPWERRQRRLAVLTRRHTGMIATALVVILFGWILLRVEARRRAVRSTRATIGNVMRAVEAFRADHDGRCPEGFAELLNPPAGHEPYLARVPKDGWGRDLRMRCPGRKHPETADVRSGGPSGNFEDRDQIE
jgi:general secretion pathway protein G